MRPLEETITLASHRIHEPIRQRSKSFDIGIEDHQRLRDVQRKSRAIGMKFRSRQLLPRFLQSLKALNPTLLFAVGNRRWHMKGKRLRDERRSSLLATFHRRTKDFFNGFKKLTILYNKSWFSIQNINFTNIFTSVSERNQNHGKPCSIPDS